MAQAAWNPPPPEGEEARSPDVDAIGDTVFSKAWALSMLVKAVALVDKKEEAKAEEGGSSSDAAATAATDKKSEISAPPRKKPAHDFVDRKLELDEETDNDLCRLWDAAVNESVAVFLCENNAVPLLMGVVNRSPYPRLAEIALGILGNMACFEPICRQAFCSPEIARDVLFLVKEVDPQLVLESTRVMRTCLSHESTLRTWIDAVKESKGFRSDIVFVMYNSTNVDLLRAAVLTVDRLFDLDADLMEEWATEEVVDGLCEAAEQTKMCAFDITTSVVLTLQLYCTFSYGIALMMSEERRIGPVVAGYLKVLARIKEPSKVQCQAINAALTIAEYILMERQSEATADLMKDKLIVKFLERINQEPEKRPDPPAEGEEAAADTRPKVADPLTPQEQTAATKLASRKGPDGGDDLEAEEEELEDDPSQAVSYRKGGSRVTYLRDTDSRMAKRILEHLNTTVYHRPKPKPKPNQPREREVSRFTRGNVIFRIVVDDDEED